MTFFIRANDNHTYSRLVELTMTRGVTYCKNQILGGVELEIIGTPDDFKFFQKTIDEMSVTRGATVALITEGV